MAVAGPTVPTAVRQPLPTAGAPAARIATAGSQYRKKTRHGLDKMLRDSQVVVLESTLFLGCIQGYSKIWRTVQSQAQLRSNYAKLRINQLDVLMQSDMS